MPRRSSPEGVRRYIKSNDQSWREILLAGLAEVIGSAILVFIGCMGCVGSLSGPVPHLQVSLTFGFAIASIVHIIGAISHCHISPVVSICTLTLGLTSITTTAVNILAHFVGAIIGYGMLMVVTPADYLHTGQRTTIGSFCVTTVNDRILPIQGMLVEAVATGILCIFVCACADPRNEKNPDAKAVKFGLVISMLAMATGPYTGCSLNPARSFAPALLNNDWTDHWVYWVGPIAGSFLTSLLYRAIFWPKTSTEEDAGEVSIALNSFDAEKNEK